MEALTSDLAEAVWFLTHSGGANSCSKELCRETVRSLEAKSYTGIKRG
jgi:hypothetical protein